jgi:hypothetical protein
MDMDSELTGKYQEKPNHVWLSKMVFARIFIFEQFAEAQQSFNTC